MRTFVCAATLALAAALPAHAQVHAQDSGGIRYKWHDGKGLSHYSDSLTAEAMKYGYDLVNDQGMVIRHVEHQLSPEERIAANQAAAAQAAQKRADAERVRADEQMLSVYGDENALKQVQQDQLATIDQQISTTRLNLRSQEKALTDLLSRAAELERAKQPVPRSLADSVTRQRNVVAGQRSTLLRQQGARETAQQQAAQQLEHYRGLKKAQAQQAQP